jgi:hypothetical protein
MVWDTPKHVGEVWYRYVLNRMYLVGVVEEISNIQKCVEWNTSKCVVIV